MIKKKLATNFVTLSLNSLVRALFFVNVRLQNIMYINNRWFILKNFGFPSLIRFLGGPLKKDVWRWGRFLYLKVSQIENLKKYYHYYRWIQVMIGVVKNFINILIKWRHPKSVSVELSRVIKMITKKILFLRSLQKKIYLRRSFENFWPIGRTVSREFSSPTLKTAIREKRF